jgi:uncharacterized protein (DUF58 family)
MVPSAALERRAPSRRGNVLLARLAGGLNHDFCPWANPYVRWIKHPLFILAAAAGVAAAMGATVAPQGYVVAGGLAAVMLLGVVWPWVGMLGLSASLRFERRRTREGQSVAAVLTVVNRMPWPAWGLVLERGFDEGDGGIALALARVPGFACCEFRWDFTPERRGEYPLAQPRLATAFPFGLWSHGRIVAVQSRLLVWPGIVPLTALPLQQGRSWTRGGLSDRRAGSEGDITGTRAHVPGDLLRHVHWAQTARQGRLIVCQRQASLTVSIRLVIDVRGAADSAESIDWLMRIAASTGQSLLDHDARVNVQLGDALLALEPGTAGLQRLNDALARFRPSEAFAATRQPAARRLADELEIVITTDRGAAAWRQDAPPSRRLIVLGDNAAAPPAWVSLAAGGDVAKQLRDHWERACRDAWCHAT